VCWLLVKSDGADPALIRIKRANVVVTATHATVTLPPEAAAAGVGKASLYWLVYTQTKTNPVLTATIEQIFSHPASFPKSVRDVDIANKSGDG